VLKAQQVEALRTLDQFKTALAKAEPRSVFTAVRAPFDGVIGNRACRSATSCNRGSGCEPGALDAVYVDATSRNAARDLQPGSRLDLVDAYSSRKLTGSVVSVRAASARCSTAAARNATGNFTKIVQRRRYGIAVPAEVAEQRLLRPGMSVVVSVDTKPALSPRTRTT